MTRPLVARRSPFLFLLGVLLLAYLVHRAGPERVLDGTRRPWLPSASWCSARLAFPFSRALASAASSAPTRAKPPTPVFLRTTAAAYVASILVPVGRASAEAVRVAAYALRGAARGRWPHRRGFDSSPLGHGLRSAPCAWRPRASSAGPSSPLTWVLAAHAGGSFILGCVLFLISACWGALGLSLGALFPGLTERAQSFDQALAVPGRLHARALGWCVGAWSRGPPLSLLLAVWPPTHPHARHLDRRIRDRRFRSAA